MPPHLEDLEASGKMPVVFFFLLECPDGSTVFRFEYFLPIGVVLQTAPLGVTIWGVAWMIRLGLYQLVIS